MPKPLKYSLKPLPLGKTTVGQRIAEIRKLRGLTQIELAEKIGITQKLVTDYERGKAHLNDEMVIRFALSLKVSSDKLLGLDKVEYQLKLPSIRYLRRMKEIEELPENKRKIILNTIDSYIRANS